MSLYEVSFASSAKRELRDLTPEVIERVLPRIRELANDPRPAGCKKLHAYKDRWRIRIGDYRVVYNIDDAGRTVDVTRIAHRRDVYKR